MDTFDTFKKNQKKPGKSKQGSSSHKAEIRKQINREQKSVLLSAFLNTASLVVTAFLNTAFLVVTAFLLFSFLITCSQPTENNKVTFSGTVTLEDATDYSPEGQAGITVSLYAPAELYQPDGSWEIKTEKGRYNIIEKIIVL